MLTGQGTVDFTSKLPIEAVHVNKGTYPTGAHAIHRYVPAVLSETGLGLKPVVLSGIDHIVLCWTTPTTTTTTTATTVPKDHGGADHDHAGCAADVGGPNDCRGACPLGGPDHRHPGRDAPRDRRIDS